VAQMGRKNDDDAEKQTNKQKRYKFLQQQKNKY